MYVYIYVYIYIYIYIYIYNIASHRNQIISYLCGQSKFILLSNFPKTLSGANTENKKFGI